MHIKKEEEHEKLISVLVIALSVSVTAFAEDTVTYDSTDNQITSDMSENKKTVLM